MTLKVDVYWNEGVALSDTTIERAIEYLKRNAEHIDKGETITVEIKMV